MEGPDLDGKILLLLRWIFREWYVGCSGFIWLKIRDSWRAFVNSVINFLVPQNAGNLLTS
jgi:hypothetical protein